MLRYHRYFRHNPMKAGRYSLKRLIASITQTTGLA